MNNEELREMISRFQQNGHDFLEQYCLINGNAWSLESIDNMGLEEYALRSIYSLPLKIYKYYPDTTKTITDNGKKRRMNYSIQALETNEVYLSSPDAFDDPFDSEISVCWEEFELYRIKTYAQWSKCDLPDNQPLNKVADTFLSKINETIREGKR